MPSKLETPFLQVDANVIHKVDTNNAQNLFSMWTVFARCADSVAQGRRLENLFWRLWTREIFCVDSSDTASSASISSLPRNITHSESNSTEDIPQLSRSVDSVAEDEDVEFDAQSAPMEILRPRTLRQDFCASSRSRGKERHITSDDLKKIVDSIVQQKEPLNAPLSEIASSYSPPQSEKTESVPSFEHSGSTTTESLSKASDAPLFESPQEPSSPELTASRSKTMVARGFSPSQTPSYQSMTMQTHNTSSDDSIPEPRSSVAPKIVQPKKQPRFALGGSSCEDSLSDQAHSLDLRKQPVPQHKRKMFQVGGSSEEDGSLKSAIHSSRNSLLSAQKKQASFSNQLVTRIPSAPAVIDELETEGDVVDESAINDDDDSSDWEDSIEDGGKSSIDDKTYFQRVDSKANLTSRRSLITLMLAQNERQQKLGSAASQSTSAVSRTRSTRQPPSLVASPNHSDDSPLKMRRGTRGAPLRPINEIPRSSAQPIMTTTNNIAHQAALSPRTTRRNMLSTELTESLRRHLLWERSQKSSTANAILKHRHTLHDVANLKQYPEKVYINKESDIPANNWDQYFNRDAFNGYHSKGW